MEIANDPEVQSLMMSYYMLPEIQAAIMTLNEAEFPVLRQGAMFYALSFYYSVVGNAELQRFASAM